MKVLSMLLIVALFLFQIPVMAVAAVKDCPFPEVKKSAPAKLPARRSALPKPVPAPVQPFTFNVIVENKTAAEQQSSMSVSQSPSPNLEMVMEKMLTMDRQHQETLRAMIVTHERELASQHKTFLGLLATERMDQRNNVVQKKDFSWKSFLIGTGTGFAIGLVSSKLGGTGTKVNITNTPVISATSNSDPRINFNPYLSSSAHLGGINVSNANNNKNSADSSSNSNSNSDSNSNSNSNSDSNSNSNSNSDSNAYARANQNQGQAQNANANASSGNDRRTIPPPPPPDPVVIVGDGTNNSVHSNNDGTP